MCGRAGVLVAVVCVVCALGRVLPPPPAAHVRFKSRKPGGSKQLTRGATAAHWKVQPQHLDDPHYVFRSVLDSPPEAQARLQEDYHDPEVTGGFFQGDMVGLTPDALEMNTRVALKWEVFPEKRWPNGTVPYAISPLYGPSEYQMIKTAIYTLQFMTCLNFPQWDGVSTDYLLIWPMQSSRGCWSYVGRRGGMQVVSLQEPDHLSNRCFVSLGKPIHELLHALGIFHEQARADRDDHVTIITENIIPEYIHNFNKQSSSNTTFPFPYDYSSVMHYGSNFFSYTRSQPTIVPKVPGVHIGQRIMLSIHDCLKLNDLYGCLDDRDDRIKYTNLCNILGLR